jgi:hypothetical protein
METLRAAAPDPAERGDLRAPIFEFALSLQSVTQELHTAGWHKRYRHRHARACAPILSVGSGAHSRDHTGDRTGSRDSGAVPHRMSCPPPGIGADGSRRLARAAREVARSTGGQLSSGYVRTSNQGTHRANADTITPAQYQRRSASSLIGSSSPFS